MLQFFRHHSLKWRNTSTIIPAFQSEISRLNHIGYTSVTQPPTSQTKDSRNQFFSPPVPNPKKSFLKPSDHNPNLRSKQERTRSRSNSRSNSNSNDYNSSPEGSEFNPNRIILVEVAELEQARTLDYVLPTNISNVFGTGSDHASTYDINSVSLSKIKETVVNPSEFQMRSSDLETEPLFQNEAEFRSQLSPFPSMERNDRTSPTVSCQLRSISSPSNDPIPMLTPQDLQASLKSFSSISVLSDTNGSESQEKLSLARNEQEPVPATYSERYTKEFREIEQLGKGGFGSVFKVQNKFDRTKYAVKKILIDLGSEHLLASKNSEEVTSSLFGRHSISSSQKNGTTCSNRTFSTSVSQVGSNLFSDASSVLSPTDSKQAFREVLTMARLKHRNIVRYHQAWLEPVHSNQPELRMSSSECFESKSRVSSGSQTSSVPGFDFADSQGSWTNEKSEKFNSREDSMTSIVSSGSTVTNLSSTFRTLYIQMELCCKQTLSEWLVSQPLPSSSSSRLSLLSRSNVDTSQNLEILRQILKALSYIHKKGIIHRDLKPSNIFLSQNSKSHKLQIKIGDFGLSTHYERNHQPHGDAETIHRSALGTSVYASPQQINSQPYGPKTDIFSLGIIVLEMYHIFSTQMERLKTLDQGRNSIFSDDFRTRYPMESPLVSSMLSIEEKERPTASSLLSSVRAALRAKNKA